MDPGCLCPPQGISKVLRVNTDLLALGLGSLDGSELTCLSYVNSA